MNQLYEFTTENKKLLQEAWNIHRKSPLLAIEKLDKILTTQQNIFGYFFKASILRAQGKPDEALKIVAEGLGYDQLNPFLLYLRAQISAWDYLKAPVATIVTSLQLAGNSTTQAQEYLRNKECREKIEDVKQYLPEEIRDELPKPDDWRFLDTNIRNLHSLIIISSKVAEDKKSVDEKINGLEKQIEKERTRAIELLGLFTAIIAFIFSSIHFASNLQTIPEIMIAIIGMGAALLVFLLTLHMILDETARRKPLIYLFIILVIVLLGLPWYAKWVGPQHISTGKASEPSVEQIFPPPAAESQPIDKAPALTDKASKPGPSEEK